jgi:tubulin epsilon
MNNNNNINNGVNKNKKEHFKEMNGIIANLLSNLTSSMRFEGTLNIDLNEITMNMVPFPSLKFLIPATNIDINNNLLNRQVDDMFKSILNPLN